MGEELERLLAQRASASEAEIPFFLGVVAMRLGDWELAARALRSDVLDNGASAAAWSNLGRCSWELGRCAEAEGFFASAIALEPWAVATARALRTVRRWRRRCEALPWWSPAWASDGEVLLEPMGPKHVQGFWQHCRGPSVVERTPLPVFGSPGAVAAHLATIGAQVSPTTFAVVQRRFGFVGEVTLERHAACGAELSFWIGEEFQGRRYGTRAARLAVALAARMAIDEVIAHVARDNHRSMAALLAAGGSVSASSASPWTVSFRPAKNEEMAT